MKVRTHILHLSTDKAYLPQLGEHRPPPPQHPTGRRGPWEEPRDSTGQSNVRFRPNAAIVFFCDDLR